MLTELHQFEQKVMFNATVYKNSTAADLNKLLEKELPYGFYRLTFKWSSTTKAFHFRNPFGRQNPLKK